MAAAGYHVQLLSRRRPERGLGHRLVSFCHSPSTDRPQTVLALTLRRVVSWACWMRTKLGAGLLDLISAHPVVHPYICLAHLPRFGDDRRAGATR
jgi:hypothetical protein